ncbi:MAG: hypothetical protein JNL74_09020, partial [Fibrobacteres bacterium]|nr:hypothetical protein [Fibrobacterota bacterium]
MKFFIILIAVSLTCAANFTVLPKAVDMGDSVRITFAVSEYTDATVEIINKADSGVVCELGSGLLGSNPPPPFQANSLSQTIYWDKKDNRGNVFNGNWTIRVGLSIFADLDRIYNNDTRNVIQTLSPKA